MSRHDFNSGKHIDDIISRTVCDRHGANEGYACWYIRLNNGLDSPAVCGTRIWAAGFVGKINPNSLKLKERPGSSYYRR